MALYLGLDCGTQGMKALLIDAGAGAIIASAAVSYGADLPQYGCAEGFLPHSDPLLRHAPPLLWADALDLVLLRLQATGVPMHRVMALSGAAQQHGSVYLNDRFAQGQLGPALSRNTSPIWMDSSTSAECREIADRLGPRLQTDTGSPAIERFTGPQVRKFWKEDCTAYERTATIHLVSSFLCSLLIGGQAPIDPGDGAGMNLLNLRTQCWDEEALSATAPGLLAKLPRVAPSGCVAGSLHGSFERYGLRAGIPVITWSGDNPSSLIGTGAWKPGTAVISLGTSDVLFAAMPQVRTDPGGCGHVFGNPAGGFMSLICFKNGSLARERMRADCGLSWEGFEAALQETLPGNEGNLMLPYYVPEITPRVLTPGLRMRGTPALAQRVRTLVEGQALAMRLHARFIGERFAVVRVTGGASRSPGLLRVLSDVFQAVVETIAIPDSAALGAALRAAQAAGGGTFEELSRKFCSAVEQVLPDPALEGVYEGALRDYAELEASRCRVDFR